jgi:hypothetical protein
VICFATQDALDAVLRREAEEVVKSEREAIANWLEDEFDWRAYCADPEVGGVVSEIAERIRTAMYAPKA